MSDYTPDRWVVLELKYPNREPVRKLFAGWYGGYLGSDLWKLNSGITNIRVDDSGHYEFDGYSGSTYFCHANGHGMNSYMMSVIANWHEKMPGLEITEIDLEFIEPVVV